MKRFEENGNSLVLTAVDGELKVLMGIRDQIRPGVKRRSSKIKKIRREKPRRPFRRQPRYG